MCYHTCTREWANPMIDEKCIQIKTYTNYKESISSVPLLKWPIQWVLEYYKFWHLQNYKKTKHFCGFNIDYTELLFRLPQTIFFLIISFFDSKMIKLPCFCFSFCDLHILMSTSFDLFRCKKLFNLR